MQKSMLNEVILISTLHQLHYRVEAYSLDVLGNVLCQLAPGIICGEVSPEMLIERPNLDHKIEYWRVILPYADRHNCVVYPLEPEEPQRSQWVSAYQGVHQRLAEEAPEKMEAFSTFVETIMGFLEPSWNSALSVNSPMTDTLFEIKHRFQNQLFGEEEVRCWNQWNDYFLEQILKANCRHQSERIVVTVGAEHHYWLEKALRPRSDLHLVTLEEALSSG